MNEQTVKKSGRPQKSPEGKRVTIHVSLSPLAFKMLQEICDRPIEPLSHSAMIEHLIKTRDY